MNKLYIISKHVVWRFGICNYFREIFKFRDFMNTLRNFAKSVFAHIFAFIKLFSHINADSVPMEIEKARSVTINGTFNIIALLTG